MQGTADPHPELLDAAALCRSLLRDGGVEAFLADHRRDLFPDAMFEDLFPSRRGRPSVPADVVASVMVLQALEGLSDREAARALADRISWKVACGLALTDPGFDHTVLTYWRSRLRSSASPERVFEAVRGVVAATGVLATRTRRALDSTLLDDAVATQDTVTQLTAQLRRVRRLLGDRAPAGRVPDDGRAKPLIDWSDEAARAGLVHDLVSDALEVLRAVEGVELDEDQADALALLALVAGQDVELEDGRWRVARRVAPERVVSVVDPESRHMHKSPSLYRDGYKAHLAVEPETGIVTACALTPATTSDARTAAALLATEEAPRTVYADAAYGSGEALAQIRDAGHLPVVKPYPSHRPVPGGLHRDDFTVDHAARTATCPGGHTLGLTGANNAIFGSRCEGCALRARCTTNRQGRTLHLSAFDAELVESRRRWRDEGLKKDYRKWRPLVERSISWLVRGQSRHVRFRGVERNQLGLSTRVAALNLRRLVNLGLDFDNGWVLAGP